MPSSPKSQTPIHLQYRNGTYYGQVSSNYKRNGKGMLILDTSTVIFADWKQNQVDGMYIYLADGIRAYGNMINQKLDGYNIISTISSYSNISQSKTYAENNKVRTFYGILRNQKVYGRSVLVDSDHISVVQFNNNQIQQILSKRSLREKQLYQVLSDIFPSSMYTLDEYLTCFIKQFISEIEQLTQITRYQPCINYFSQQSAQKFFGFQQISKPNKKFGILMVGDQLVSIGEHNNNLLQGIGRMYMEEQVVDGAWRNGEVDGLGIFYHTKQNKFVVNLNQGPDNTAEKGFGFPLREILEFRKEFHLRSIYFYNDMAILGLKSKFQEMISQIFMPPKRIPQYRQVNDFDRQSAKNSRSGAKRIQNSPLRQRLSRYQLQSDIIQDNSPIKSRPINQYRPINHSSSYFPQQSRSNSRNQHTNPSYNLTSNSRHSPYIPKNNERFSQQKSKSKHQQRQSRQLETYKQIVREVQPTKRMDNFVNLENANRNRKHTNDLVRELDNREHQRRLTLDQIYQKSGLYGRNKR